MFLRSCFFVAALLVEAHFHTRSCNYLVSCTALVAWNVIIISKPYIVRTYPYILKYSSYYFILFLGTENLGVLYYKPLKHSNGAVVLSLVHLGTPSTIHMFAYDPSFLAVIGLCCELQGRGSTANYIFN